MGAEARRLAQQLRAALRLEEPLVVQELLHRGADPNLVLADGAAAVHLAARARSPRALQCLQALLRRGADPNARSAEALTPLHVAAAWGCRQGLEILLTQGGDSTLQDQDGLQPLDWALQQGHQDCARILQELDTPAWTPEETPEPTNLRVSGCSFLSPDPTQLQTQPSDDDNRDRSLNASPGLPGLNVFLGIAAKDRHSETLARCQDFSSDGSFVTAVEVSAAEDSALEGATFLAKSLPQMEQPGLNTPGRVSESEAGLLSHGAVVVDQETELIAHLKTWTLISTEATGCSSSSSPLGLLPPLSILACNPLQEPQPGSATIPSLPDDQTHWDSTMAKLWLTEDETSILCDQDSDPSNLHQSVPIMSDLELLQALQALGHSPGPVTSFTRPHYLRLLQKAQTGHGPEFVGHSPELVKALRTGQIPDCQADEDVLAQEFEHPDPTKKWREGVVKSSFTYLLLDPRETKDLPARAFSLTLAECLQTFVRAVFYVGKGTRARPDSHLWEALSYHKHPRKQACPKVHKIRDIWDNGRGVISLHCFQHVVAVEAYTREACLLDALGIQTLTNQKQGHYYGVVAGWPPTRRRCLGVHLLHRALLIFLAEGERELRPQDIQARG
uniref:ankyrin repeat and LEM domain-containing protein 1 n=1 Tax=Jaculus jaculus TaxID=51337 RepID=UPI001E1B1300|nr:ankyrin repeat and LEM domain-containing protein 1 [Jaculus jaculus]